MRPGSVSSKVYSFPHTSAITTAPQSSFVKPVVDMNTRLRSLSFIPADPENCDTMPRTPSVESSAIQENTCNLTKSKMHRSSSPKFKEALQLLQSKVTAVEDQLSLLRAEEDEYVPSYNSPSLDATHCSLSPIDDRRRTSHWDCQNKRYISHSSRAHLRHSSSMQGISRRYRSSHHRTYSHSLSYKRRSRSPRSDRRRLKRCCTSSDSASEKFPSENVPVEGSQFENEEPGSRLATFAHMWTGAPQSTRRILTRGYHWTWSKPPPPLGMPSHRSKVSLELRQEVFKLVSKGAVYPVPWQRAYTSPIFLVPKTTGGWRLILDLSSLNKFILTPKFRMTNHSQLAEIMTPPAWMASLDLQDAYLHIPIRQSLHRYLAFVLEDQLFFFRALPFGLSPAPAIFTRVLRWPLSILRCQNVRILAYLDDWVIWAPSREELLRSVELTCN